MKLTARKKTVCSQSKVERTKETRVEELLQACRNGQAALAAGRLAAFEELEKFRKRNLLVSACIRLFHEILQRDTHTHPNISDGRIQNRTSMPNYKYVPKESTSIISQGRTQGFSLG